MDLYLIKNKINNGYYGYKYGLFGYSNKWFIKLFYYKNYNSALEEIESSINSNIIKIIGLENIYIEKVVLDNLKENK